MIDKVWYDWQHRNPRNKGVFGGGSISWQVNTTQSFAEYPTGAPPWLNVRENPLVDRGCGEGIDVQQTSSPIPSDGLWGDIVVDDVMDTVGGRLCYIYA